ncbi:MAG: radical SAM family heme chaperone HemW [Oscillospiraceae bacterium]|nr:radical SAM family heme chaperone HemW [Oscillospiraceae bacterium]
MAGTEKIGIYIHIPFCARKCAYCDFYSAPYRADAAERYVGAVCHQLAGYERRAADSVYFGGGTPSLLADGQTARLLDAVRGRMDVDGGAEITLEANPATASPEKLRALRAAGINRLSVGVQSTNDAALRALGRLHTAKQALQFLDDAAAAGFDNISADVMLAVPGDTEQTVLRSIRDLSAAPVCHISAYLLKRMPGTPFYDAPPPGIPDDDAAAGLYELACAALEERGFHQYEISNFAQPGRESRHNLKYWSCGDYLGLGPAASACVGRRRYSYRRDLAAYLRDFSAPPQTMGNAQALALLEDEGEVTQEDYIILRLRTAQGLDLKKLRSLYGYTFGTEKEAFLQRCARAGLLQRTGDTVALTRRGFLVSNSILASLI